VLSLCWWVLNLFLAHTSARRHCYHQDRSKADETGVQVLFGNFRTFEVRPPGTQCPSAAQAQTGSTDCTPCDHALTRPLGHSIAAVACQHDVYALLAPH
jgi:hypothetical protein